MEEHLTQAWKAVYTIAVWFLPLISACSEGSDQELPLREPTDRLRAVLAQAPDTGSAVVPLTFGDTLRVSRQTLAFYRRLKYAPAWLEDGKPGRRAAALHATIGRAEDDGLIPARYGQELAQRLLAAVSDSAAEAADGEGLDEWARASYLADLDLVLSEGFMRYATDVVQGTIAPENVGRAWRMQRPAAPTENVLRAVVRGGDPQQIVQRLRPSTPYYTRLMAALQRLRQVRDSGGWTPLPETTGVAEGDSSDAVARLRARLAASDDPREAALAQAGAARPAVFDRELRDALRHYQERHALDDDGRLGAGTLRELNHPVDERIAEVNLNLDRWRWLPRDLGQLFILVNIAGFELEVVEHNRAIEAMNVVVGKPGWETPVFADTVRHLVVNPSWTPPPSIVKEEILPAIARDPTYLARHGFERTRDGGFRQPPGPKNPLGRYKFLFPNDEDIYLHDTPADHLFSRARRDFSHGCIRLERPADLARLVLAKATNHSPASLEAMVDTRKEKWVSLKRPIPIYIVYFTTWVKEDGTLHFHHDVYGHDEELEQERQRLHRPTAVQRVADVSAGGSGG
jgi:murein L,D-transpeptidase YcbB/YkuD